MDPFLSTILPVFSVIGLGYLCARAGYLSRDEAATLNRFLFYVGLPPLLFRLVVTAPADQFNPVLLASFVAVEAVVYAIGATVARKLFGFGLRRALLVGLASAFANHLFLVLPIAVYLYGTGAAVPIVGMVTLDAVLFIAGTAVALDVLEEDAPAGPGLLKRIGKAVAGNTQVWGVAAGLVVVLAGIPVPAGVDTFTEFVAGACGPVGLVALGIILAGSRGQGDVRVIGFIGFMKLLVHPVAALLMVTAAGFAFEEARPALMVAAGPSGALALVLATRHDILVDEIARAVLYTHILSLGTVTLITLL